MGLTDLLKQGFKVTIFSTGKLKRPDEIKRTSAFEDIMKKKEKKDESDKR